MGIDFDDTAGQTLLTLDEKEGLKIPFIRTRNDLNEFENANIADARRKLILTPPQQRTVLSVQFVNRLHRLMFGDVWHWAGAYRTSTKNLGVEYWNIASDLRNLVNDAKSWVSHKSYPPDEIAIRFKHRIVCIHCYPNGNGRHSRFIADIIAERIFHQAAFTWGRRSYTDPATLRADYLIALRAADDRNFQPLLEFSRS